MMQNPIQLGWIPYWNLLPMFRELHRIAGGQLKVLSGHPSSVSRWLMDGSVHLAPASSIALIKSKNLEMAMPLGIASEGPVLSVYVGLHREHETFFEFVRSRQQILREKLVAVQALYPQDARKQAAFVWSSVRQDRLPVTAPDLKLTTASAASAALTRVLMNLWLGEHQAHQMMLRATATLKEQSFGDAGFRPMELVIGDEALQRRHEFWKILDLGQVWQELTNLPFVFGLWQTSHQSLPVQLRSLIWEAASIAQARMQVEPQIYFPDNTPMTGDGKPVDLAAYWKVIQYKLTDRHLKALLLYYALYHQISVSEEDHWISERFVRWNQSWQTSYGNSL
jgi:predicted solute-binding protein